MHRTMESPLPSFSSDVFVQSPWSACFVSCADLADVTVGWLSDATDLGSFSPDRHAAFNQGITDNVGIRVDCMPIQVNTLQSNVPQSCRPSETMFHVQQSPTAVPLQAFALQPFQDYPIANTWLSVNHVSNTWLSPDTTFEQQSNLPTMDQTTRASSTHILNNVIPSPTIDLNTPNSNRTYSIHTCANHIQQRYQYAVMSSTGTSVPKCQSFSTRITPIALYDTQHDAQHEEVKDCVQMTLPEFWEMISKTFYLNLSAAHLDGLLAELNYFAPCCQPLQWSRPKIIQDCNNPNFLQFFSVFERDMVLCQYETAMMHPEETQRNILFDLQQQSLAQEVLATTWTTKVQINLPTPNEHKRHKTIHSVPKSILEEPKNNSDQLSIISKSTNRRFSLRRSGGLETSPTSSFRRSGGLETTPTSSFRRSGNLKSNHTFSLRRSGGLKTKRARSQFMGVYPVNKHKLRWRAQIRIPTISKKNIFLGGYETEIEAAFAYDDAIYKYQATKVTNFSEEQRQILLRQKKDCGKFNLSELKFPFGSARLQMIKESSHPNQEFTKMHSEPMRMNVHSDTPSIQQSLSNQRDTAFGVSSPCVDPLQQQHKDPFFIIAFEPSTIPSFTIVTDTDPILIRSKKRRYLYASLQPTRRCSLAPPVPILSEYAEPMYLQKGSILKCINDDNADEQNEICSMITTVQEILSIVHDHNLNQLMSLRVRLPSTQDIRSNDLDIVKNTFLERSYVKHHMLNKSS